jgi:lipoprotein NlpI
MKAVADYNTAIRLDPRYAVAYLNRGLALLRLNRESDAQRDFAEALRLDEGLKTTLERLLRAAKEPRAGKRH